MDIRWNQSELDIIEAIRDKVESGEIGLAAHLLISKSWPSSRVLVALGYILGPEKFEIRYRTPTKRIPGDIALYYPAEFDFSLAMISVRINRDFDQSEAREILLKRIKEELGLNCKDLLKEVVQKASYKVVNF